MSEVETIILGDEYDELLRETLQTVLLKKGAKILSGDWSLGGSQELEIIEVDLEGEKIRVESETFIGLSIRGSKASVQGLARDINDAMGRSLNRP